MFFFKRKPIVVHNEMMITVITKACKDELFRKELLHNPKETIERELNIKIPDDVKIIVQEDTEKVIHLTLPPMPKIIITQESDTDYSSSSSSDYDRDHDPGSTPGRYYC